MTRRRLAIVAGVCAAVAIVAIVVVALVSNRAREGRRTTAQLHIDLVTLRAERDRLKPHVLGALQMDPRLAGMPSRQVLVGLPTSLARDLVSKFITGVADQMTLHLSGIRVQKKGEVRRLVPLGDWTLSVLLTRVTARLASGAPDVRFGDNRLSLTAPIRVVSGTGEAAINFQWDGRNISGALCGDMELKATVTGSVTPETYPLTGALHLSTTNDAIVLTPRIPATRISVRVVPSKESWAMVQARLDEKGGLCGFVLDRANIPGSLEEFLAKGFEVRLPTEKLKPWTLPIGLASSLTIRDMPVQVAVTDGELAATGDMIWFSADIDLVTGALPPRPPVR
jgi:hypothetical protein